MDYRIASQLLRVDCGPGLAHCLQPLSPYQVEEDPAGDAVGVGMLRFRFP